MRSRGRGVEAPDWGIDPVPRDRRVFSGLDLAILWGDLGIGLLVLVTGALLVPGLGFAAALLAIVVGSVIGVGLLSLVAVAGADHGIPTMVLFRPVLGLRGSWVPSFFNVLQLIGWTAVELMPRKKKIIWVRITPVTVSKKRYWNGKQESKATRKQK